MLLINWLVIHSSRRIDYLITHISARCDEQLMMHGHMTYVRVRGPVRQACDLACQRQIISHAWLACACFPQQATTMLAAAGHAHAHRVECRLPARPATTTAARPVRPRVGAELRTGDGCLSLSVSTWWVTSQLIPDFRGGNPGGEVGRA